jgi:hypothetical protein
MMFRSACFGFAFTVLLGGVSGFVVPTPSRVSTTPSNSKLYSDTSTGYDSFERLKKLTNVPSGEGQRKFRRTVYSHDDWKKHRQQDRFIVYLAAIFKSGVYKNLAGEVTLATLIATFVCVYNLIVGGYTDFAGVQHDAIISSPFLPKIGLPLAAFTLTSPSLGLLLGRLREQLTLSSCFHQRRDFTVSRYSFLKTPPSFPYQHFLPALGRSPKELGNEH